jgi:IS30 family transposase
VSDYPIRVAPRQRKRRSDSLLTDAILDRFSTLHQEGMSVNEIARQEWRGLGYRSRLACCSALYRALKKDEYEVREHRDSRAAVLARYDRPRCKGKASRNRGRCHLLAREGSEFWAWHGPKDAAHSLAATERAELSA